MFFYWVGFYHNLYTEMIGPEREEMLAVIDEDVALDGFLERLQKTRQAEMAKTYKGPRGLTKQEYLAKHVKEVSGY